MKNPLVLFVAAAVMAVAALAGVTADRWQDWAVPFQPTAASPEVVVEESIRATADPEVPEMKDPAPGVDMAGPVEPQQVPPEPVSEPASEPPSEPVAEPEIAEVAPAEPVVEVPAEVPVGEPDEPVAEPERLAAIPPQELESPAPSAPAVPEPEPEPEATVDPSFDVVRLEDDGSLIVAGRAAPGAEVALLLGGEVIARDAANQFGAWLILLDEPLSPGSHELMVQASDGLGATTSSQGIALAVPQRGEDRQLATRSEPSRPDALDEAAEVAELPVLEEEPAPEELARLEPADALPAEAAEEQVALAPIPEPVVEPEAPPAPEAAPQVREAAPEELAAITPEPEIEPEVEMEPVPERLEVPLALETIDYNDDGDIVFSGRASSGRTVRIHVDGQLVGEAMADEEGRWLFAGDGQITAGRHTLRADLMGETGRILGRIILPFMRAGSREVAALVDGRRAAAERREALTPAPEPEPEAPAVAEEVTPEPEPEAPAVAEEVAPEPEPEAPVVAEEVRPEPEPEAPAAAEEVTPEPEPEAPVVAEEVVPEPEPEAPAVAEELVPEPEAPAVAEEVMPEPEPEAPAVAEMVMPERQREAPAPAMAPKPGKGPEPARLDPVKPGERARIAALAEPPTPAEAPEVVPASPGHVVIQPGNNLWRISRVIYGRGVEYTMIYEANRDQIDDPNLIYPGQIFATPGVNPPKEIDPGRREPLSPEDLARQEAAE